MTSDMQQKQMTKLSRQQAEWLITITNKLETSDPSAFADGFYSCKEEVKKIINQCTEQESSQAKREREAKEALQNMKNNCDSETIRVAVDKSFLANFGHMYE